MVTYIYNISSSGPTATIQTAINNIVGELSEFPTIERDIEISIGKGTYGGFTIPDGSLYALYSSGYKLKIRSGGKYFPIIDFNYSNENQTIGIDVGAGNPNVEIEGLRIQYFAAGVRASTNSHYCKVKNCIVSNNRNAGIFFDQVSQAQALQNIVINGDYGIVARLCKSAAIIHNTVFLNGAIATEKGKSISAIWAELANDYGNGIADKGQLHLVGNIAWNTSGRCLTLFMADVETQDAVISNFNDWVVGDVNNFICLEDNAFYKGAGVRPRVIFKSLNEFKALEKDSNSVSQDPKFISAVKIRSSRNGFAVDLNLLPVSPILGLVPGFAYNTSLATEWLPNYVDSADFAKDILHNNRRQNFTAAGANDKSSAAGFFGQDIFSDPLDLDISKECNKNPFSNVLYKNLDLWYPELKVGYFYSNEREYYLYSKKGFGTIGNIAQTEFTLPAQTSQTKEIKIKVAGKEIDSTYYDLYLNKLLIKHKDLPIITLEEEVVIEGFITAWKDESFNYNKVTYIQKFNEGTTKYYLPSNYVNRGPVVITDDRTSVTDDDQKSNREFSLVFDKELELTEIHFNNQTNLLTNGQFDYHSSDDLAPYGFNSYNAVVEGKTHPYYSIAGDNICKVYNNGYLEKTVAVDTGNPYVYSFYTTSLASGFISYDVRYFDSSLNFLGVASTGGFYQNSEWDRKSIKFNFTSNLETGLLIGSETVIADLSPPSTTAFADIKLSYQESPANTGATLFSAFQYEKGIYPSIYNRKPYLNELTVEYETSANSGFIDTKLVMSPVINLITDGFLYIPEVPARDYNGPMDVAVTTLHEWRWPEGRKNILPWARTKGKDKLRKRVKNRYHSIPQSKPEIIAPANLTPSIKEVDLIPSQPSAIVGDQDGVGFTIKATDMNGNPYAINNILIEIYDTNFKNPGLLSKKFFGVKEQLGTSILSKTDIAGSISLTWYPPEEESCLYKGGLPQPSYSSINGNLISVINTEYQINDELYGNVIILDNNRNKIPTQGSIPISSTYTPTYTVDSSIVNLRYPPVGGTVKVRSKDTSYNETQVNILESDQFFVDYGSSSVVVKGRVEELYISYIPSYVYVNPSNKNRLLLYYDKLFNGTEQTITVGYDYTINLKITLGHTDNVNLYSKEYTLLAKNKLAINYNIANELGMEI